MTSVDGLRSKIHSAEIEKAFDFLGDSLPMIPGLTCEPEKHGYMSSLRVRRGGEWSFSIAPASNWLLFYIRKPELRRGRFTLETVREWFPEASESRYGEIIFRLRDERAARKLVVFIASVG